MKKFGCLIATLGLAMFGGSLGLFGTAILRATQANKVTEVTLEPGRKASTELLTVDTSKACQVAVELDIESRSVQEAETMGERGVSLRYCFPFSYRVLDADGKLLFSEQGRLDWNKGTRITHGSSVDLSGGTATIQHNLEKLDIEPPGRIKVEAMVSPDTQHGAVARAVTLGVYDNVSRHAKSVGAGVLLLLAGPFVSIVGIALFLLGLSTRGKPQQTSPPPPNSYDPGPPVVYEIKE